MALQLLAWLIEAPGSGRANSRGGMNVTGYAMSTRRIYAEAYELKAGGFRGVAMELDGKATVGEPRKGEVVETLAEARNAAIALAEELLAGRPFSGGSYRNPRNQWRFNYWLG